jgi:nucleoside-diphosphate-sugar epimerase
MVSENVGIEGVRFAVTGGLGLVGAALSLELLRRGAQEVRCLDLRASSCWSQKLLDAGVRVFQGPLTRSSYYASPSVYLNPSNVIRLM